jgi:two-component system sensor histidine kinase EvgS
MKQNHGFINVYSEPGKGTTFKLYFPACTDTVLRSEKAVGKVTGLGNGETILLVEDDPVLLAMACKMLKKLEYNVLTANTPSEACSLAEAYSGDIHLLLTDVIMPGMNGKELANLLQSHNRSLKCLFTSGYTANVIEHSGVLDKDIHFIQKPYSFNSLALKILDVLG